MGKIFRQVKVSDRVPDTHFEPYFTDIGLLFGEEIESKGAIWWLEEIELPTQDNLIFECRNKTSIRIKSFVKGANFILDKLKGGNNG